MLYHISFDDYEARVFIISKNSETYGISQFELL